MTTLTITLDDIIAGTPEAASVTLAQLNDLLPEATTPLGSYVPVMRSGSLAFTSGALPLVNGQLLHEGAIGSYTLGVTAGQQAARACVINLLSSLKLHLGGLDNIKHVVKLTGFVNSTPTFTEQPRVINGASDLLVQLLGDAGKHARSAVGVAALPMNAPVEIELIVEVQ